PCLPALVPAPEPERRGDRQGHGGEQGHVLGHVGQNADEEERAEQQQAGNKADLMATAAPGAAGHDSPIARSASRASTRAAVASSARRISPTSRERIACRSASMPSMASMAVFAARRT